MKKIIPHSRPWISAKDQDALSAVLVSGRIAQGDRVTCFEDAFCRRFGYAGGVATSSGTTALVLALRASGTGGGEILLPSYVCVNVFQAVQWAGFRPILYDIDEDWGPSIPSIRAKLSAHTRAIIVVHLFGIPADVQAVCRLGIPVIEDCCQAVGLPVGGRVAGSYGDYGVVSFHATKLMTTGEGGMAFSSTTVGCDRLREAKYGCSIDPTPGWSFPMTDLQAGLGLSQLRRYDCFLERRSTIARRYLEILADWPEVIPSALLGRSIFFRFPLRITELDYEAVKNDYMRRGIQVRRGVDAVLHHRTGEPDGAFPNTMETFAETLSIPLYPALTDGEVDHIANATKEVLRRYAH